MPPFPLASSGRSSFAPNGDLIGFAPRYRNLLAPYARRFYAVSSFFILGPATVYVTELNCSHRLRSSLVGAVYMLSSPNERKSPIWVNSLAFTACAASAVSQVI